MSTKTKKKNTTLIKLRNNINTYIITRQACWINVSSDLKYNLVKCVLIYNVIKVSTNKLHVPFEVDIAIPMIPYVLFQNLRRGAPLAQAHIPPLLGVAPLGPLPLNSVRITWFICSYWFICRCTLKAWFYDVLSHFICVLDGKLKLRFT